MKRKTSQYTIRDIPERLDRRLRETATDYGVSFNKALLAMLGKGVGLTEEPPVYHDLDDLVGSWVADPTFDQAMKDMDRVDKGLWR